MSNADMQNLGQSAAFPAMQPQLPTPPGMLAPAPAPPAQKVFKPSAKKAPPSTSQASTSATRRLPTPATPPGSFDMVSALQQVLAPTGNKGRSEASGTSSR